MLRMWNCARGPRDLRTRPSNAHTSILRVMHGFLASDDLTRTHIAVAGSRRYRSGGRYRSRSPRSRSRSPLPSPARDLPDPLVLSYKCKSYAQFVDGYPPETLPAELEGKYTGYKSAWEIEAGAAFFHAHHTEEWIRTRYHPVLSKSESEVRKAWAVARSAVLHTAVTAGADNPGGDVIDRLAGSQMGSTVLSEDLWIVNPKCTLFLHSLPPTISREDLLSDPIIAALDGLLGVFLSEPSTLSKIRYRRSAWLLFDRASQAIVAKELLNVKQLLLAPSAEEIIKQLNVIRVVKALEVKDAGDSTSNEIAIAKLWSKLSFDTVFDKSVPSSVLLKPEWYTPRSTIRLPADTSAPDQVDRDLTRAMSLAAALDTSAGVPAETSLTSILATVEYRVLSELQKLDLCVLYLASVHMYEYYSGRQHGSLGTLLDSWRPHTRTPYEPGVEGAEEKTPLPPASSAGGEGEGERDGSDSDEDKPGAKSGATPTPSGSTGKQFLEARLAAAYEKRLAALTAGEPDGDASDDVIMESTPQQLMDIALAADEKLPSSAVLALFETLKAALLSVVADDEYLRPFYESQLAAELEPDSDLPESEWKHRCKCGKLFKNKAFAVKHVANKHEEEVCQELTRLKKLVGLGVDIAIYHRALKALYLADPDRPMPQLKIMHWVPVKVKPERDSDRDNRGDNRRDASDNRRDTFGGDRREDRRPVPDIAAKRDDRPPPQFAGGYRSRPPRGAALGAMYFSDRAAASATAAVEAAVKKIDYTGKIVDYSDI